MKRIHIVLVAFLFFQISNANLGITYDRSIASNFSEAGRLHERHLEYSPIKKSLREKSDKDYFRYSGFNAYVLNLGTIPQVPSPRWLITYGRNFQNLSTALYSLQENLFKMKDEGKWKRRAWVTFLQFAPYTKFLFFFDKVTIFSTLVVHEYAHRTRDDVFSGDVYAFNPKILPFGDNPYSYTAGVIFKNGYRAGSYTWEGITRTQRETDYLLTENERELHASMAGFNQESNIASDLARRMSLIDNVDIALFYTYLTSSMSYVGYYDWPGIPVGSNYFRRKYDPSDRTDPPKVIERWRSMGRDYLATKIANNQFYGAIFSGTTISFMKAMYTYIKTGKRESKPLRVLKTRLPDFYHYFNIGGPSFKITTDIQLDKSLYFNIAYEFIYDDGGLPYTKANDKELSLGVSKSLLDDCVSLQAELSFGMPVGGLAFDAELNVLSGKHFGLSFGGKSYDLSMLSGVRDTPANKTYHTELFGKMYFLF